MFDSKLRKLQLTEIEILQEIVSICNRFQVQYFLVGGTLLGAIRHKGFIPWDDDLDIAMPRKDYERFLELCNRHLDSKYYLHCNKTDLLYWLPFAKVRKRNTLFDEINISHLNVPKGIYVDIFPLDNANNQSNLFQKIQAILVKRMNSMIVHKKGLNQNRKFSFKKLSLIALCWLFPITWLSKTQQRIMMLNGNEESFYYVNLGSNYNYVKQTIPKTKYLPASKVEFEGALYDAPGDWDYVLKRIYNNYMELPPIEKRVTHMPVRIVFDTGAEEEIK